MRTIESASVRSVHTNHAAPAPSGQVAPARTNDAELREALRDPALPSDAWAKSLRPKAAPRTAISNHFHPTDATLASPHTASAGIPGLPEGFTAEKIGDDVAVVRAYANALIVRGKDGLIMVDTMMPNDVEGVKKTLDALFPGEKIKTIVYTHFHLDHVSLTSALREAGYTTPDVEIVGSRSSSFRLRTPQNIKFFNLTQPAQPQDAWPTTVVADKKKFPGNVEVVHFPFSHTSTDLITFFHDQKLVALGDLFIQGLYPFTDVGNGGSTRSMILTLEQILEAIPDGYAVIPGHGVVTTKDELRAWSEMAKTTVAYVRDLIEAGKTLDEIKALAGKPETEGGLPESVKRFDSQLLPRDALLTWVYEDLTERDFSALLGSRKLAVADLPINGKVMMETVFESIFDSDNKEATTEYETLKFQINELEQFAPKGALTEDAKWVFGLYEDAVNLARLYGRSTFTKDEWEELIFAMRLACSTCW